MENAAAVAIIVVLAGLAFVLPGVPERPPANIAFIGNSITFFNDLPRFMQALSNDRIHQNSCLHGGLSFLSLLQKGNGMYEKWDTENARIPDVDISLYGDEEIYDFGICSVPMLLFGRDDNLGSLSDDNDDNDDSTDDDGYYTDDDDGAFYYFQDGKNPCFQDDYYMQYLTDTYVAPEWDYVIMNDQTVAPARFKSRKKSLLALKGLYGNMFLDLPTVRPVFLVTHGYHKSEQAEEESIRSPVTWDVPEFTSRIYYGYQLYAQTLAEMLPAQQEPLIAPSGLAFLVVWEENRGMWKKLFFYDGFHPSPHGTYLIGCVLYATIFGRMPSSSQALQEDLGELWSNARKLMKSKRNFEALPLPTLAEANYLFSVAQRVVLKGYRPVSLLENEEIEAMEEEEGYSDWYNLDEVDYYYSV